MNQIELGIKGEQIAANFLKAKGYDIKGRNYKFKKNEIDLVAEFNNEIIIVEVKTRHSNELGEPWRAVTKSKQKSIVLVANDFIIQNDIHLNARFDIISIIHNKYKTEIEHIEDAFTA